IYVPRLDDPASRAFERCSSDNFEIKGPCAYQICYVYLYRTGPDGWKPEQVTLGMDLIIAIALLLRIDGLARHRSYLLFFCLYSTHSYNHGLSKYPLYLYPKRFVECDLNYEVHAGIDIVILSVLATCTDSGTSSLCRNGSPQLVVKEHGREYSIQLSLHISLVALESVLHAYYQTRD
ncbi:hypothetical protein Gohar_005897, partial [Gossypium harknessii]|nr:hypothetical protein [Gossypium harknessii]